ncbi:MAG: shikimate dehydrogenase [Bacteroidaceae bacterium]|nr:shikimate dehydrogenase [Bacteroidaceae bacterium]
MSRKFGLLGYPLQHSFSSAYHNERFARWGLDAVYENYELSDLSQLRSIVECDKELEGLNVTIPYKQSIIPLLDDIDAVAQAIGAVNVIRIERLDDVVRMVGYNSDYIGFRNSITPLLKPHHTHALVLGTGGAAKAVCAALSDMGILVKRVSRTPREGELSYDNLTVGVIAQHTIIVNTTPLGMFPHVDACAPIPYELLTSRHLCYDVVYNPATTLFMKRASEQGATVCNGLAMLYGQADAAWDIWNKQMVK